MLSRLQYRAVVCIAEFCRLNVTSSDDQALVADTDVVAVHCGVSYQASNQWKTRVHCLPDTLDQTELTEFTPEGNGITYVKFFDATPSINGIVINCTVKFDFTNYGQAVDNTPDDIQLWTSAPLHVQCKVRLCSRDKQECLFNHISSHSH